MEPLIRAADAADAELIAEIFVRTSQTAYRGILPDPYLDGLSISDRAHEIARLIAAPPPGWRIWIARSDGSTIGFCHARPSLDQDASAATGEVDSLYVESTYQRRGIGRRLLDQALRNLVKDGSSEATLWTTELNARARAFYERLGWRGDSTRRVVKLAGEDVPEVRYRIGPLVASRIITGSGGSR